MLAVCLTAKGGQGCSTITALLGLLHSEIVVVDAGGDLPAVLGLPAPEGPGLTDLLASSQPVNRRALKALTLDCCVSLIPLGHASGRLPSDRWDALARTLAADTDRWIVDAGAGQGHRLAGAADQRLLVTRHCYLALRRAVALQAAPTGAITVREPGRSLSDRDVEQVVEAPVVASVPWDSSIALAVDAGLLAGRGAKRWTRYLRAIEV